MTAKEFIIEQFGVISRDFPLVSFRYGMDSIINNHVIEITPQEQYDNNSELDNAWMEVVKIFYDKFPCDEICVVSTGSSVAIDSNIYEFNGNVIVVDSTAAETLFMNHNYEADFPLEFSSIPEIIHHYHFSFENNVISKSENVPGMESTRPIEIEESLEYLMAA